jgi:hypothetical protein
VGPESPGFALVPTTMCIFINDLALFNCSTVGLCSRRLGFPFPAQLTAVGNGLIDAWMAPGLERVLRPVERTGLLVSQAFVYQPIFERSVDGSQSEHYNTTYVRSNSFDFDAGLGALYLQCRDEVTKVSEREGQTWVPSRALSLPEAYRSRRRWAYRKLEQHYSEQGLGSDKRSLASVHKRITGGTR